MQDDRRAIPIDWSGCPAVRTRPGYLSGHPVLRDGPRVPPETIIDTMDYAETDDEGEAATEVIENFGLNTSQQDVLFAHAYKGLSCASSWIRMSHGLCFGYWPITMFARRTIKARPLSRTGFCCHPLTRPGLMSF